MFYTQTWWMSWSWGRNVFRSSQTSLDEKKGVERAWCWGGGTLKIIEPNNGNNQVSSPSCLFCVVLLKITYFLLKQPLLIPTSHNLSELPSCFIKDWDKRLLRTWSWKTVMLGLTCFAMSEHISLMFAGSNLLHNNLLTGSVNASLGDKWNCFWGMHFICNFPMKNMTLNILCIKRRLREEQTKGKFSRGLAQDGRASVAGLMWRRTSEGNAFCGAQVFNIAEVNNAWCSHRGHFHYCEPVPPQTVNEKKPWLLG